MASDEIRISGLSVHLPSGAGPSAFGLVPPPPCPLELGISLALHDNVVPHCVDEDDMAGLGVNYSSVSKAVYALLTAARTWSSPAEILDAAAAVPMALPAVKSATLSARLPRALLHADAAVYTRTYSAADGSTAGIPGPLRCMLDNMPISCVVGLHPHERAERQRLAVDIDVDSVDDAWNHKAFGDSALEYLEQSSFGTLESLADTFARHLLSLPAVSEMASVNVVIRKPSALPFATPSISVTRQRESYGARGGVSPAAVAAAGARAFSTAAGGPPKLAAVATTAAAASVASPAPASPARPVRSAARSSQGAASLATVAAAATASAAKRSGPPRVFIAVGSNIGDCIGHIRRSIKLLEQGGCKLVDTSLLYQSEPMYVTDQDVFTNGVIEVATELAPIEVLFLLKRIEATVGRTKTFRNGPRVIDLDLILYGDQVVNVGTVGDDGWLAVPHKSVAEREFVLRPLADIDPTFTHPGLGESVGELLAKVAPGGLAPIIPFPAPAKVLRLQNAGEPATPAIMAIFNATPDSFSDGAAERAQPDTALARAKETLAAQPAILDIGGMSTRPGSEPCSVDEELARVVPLVKALLPGSEGNPACTPLSVDTYRAAVAEAAIAAGASCINDVRGGREPGMLDAMAAADCPVVLMHSRGDSVSMTQADEQAYPGGIVAGVAAELAERVAAARAAGVKRWDIVLDPGLGFAKNAAQNLVLLQQLPALSAALAKECGTAFPLLVGASRKRFVGAATCIKVASERYPGDAAVNTVSAMSGVVHVLRVHAPTEATATVRMAAAIRDAKE